MFGHIGMEISLSVVDEGCILLEECGNHTRIFKYFEVDNRWLMSRITRQLSDFNDLKPEDVQILDESVLINGFVSTTLESFINGPNASKNLANLRTSAEALKVLLSVVIWVGQSLCMLHYLEKMGKPTTEERIREAATIALKTEAKYYVKNVLERLPEELAPVIERIKEFKIATETTTETEAEAETETKQKKVEMEGLIMVSVRTVVMANDAVMLKGEEHGEQQELRIFYYEKNAEKWVLKIVDIDEHEPIKKSCHTDLDIMPEQIIETLENIFSLAEDPQAAFNKIKTDVSEVQDLISFFVWAGQNLCMLDYLEKKGPPTTEKDLDEITKKMHATNVKILIKNVLELLPPKFAPLNEILSGFKLNTYQLSDR